MEDTYRAIRQGRVLADEGLYEHAMETWKAALSGAYGSQDYAGMFVLSGNVGEACVRIATRSNNSTKALQLLQEAKENLSYALQIVEQCSLREVLGGYKTLYQGVRRAETLMRTAEKLMDKLQRMEGLVAKEEVAPCTTCGVGEKVVLDENDGNYYCKKCYDAYYAAVKTEGEEVAVATENLASVRENEVTVGGLSNLGVDENSSNGSWVSQPDEQGGCGVFENIAPTSEPVQIVALAGKDEQVQEVVIQESRLYHKEAQENTEGVTQDRIRYDRVELGSLADFLAGKPNLEDEPEQLKIQQNDASRGTVIPPTDAPSGVGGEEELTEGLAVDTEHPDEKTIFPAVSDEGAAHVEKLPVSNASEQITDTIPDKRKYSIVQLLEIRKTSPSECPKSLVASPVRDDGTPARNKANNSRTKMNRKKTSSSASTRRQTTSDSATPNHVAAPEKTVISPIPTLELCVAMRKALHGHQERQMDSGSSDDTSVDAGTTMEALTAAALLRPVTT